MVKSVIAASYVVEMATFSRDGYKDNWRVSARRVMRNDGNERRIPAFHTSPKTRSFFFWFLFFSLISEKILGSFHRCRKKRGTYLLYSLLVNISILGCNYVGRIVVITLSVCAPYKYNEWLQRPLKLTIYVTLSLSLFFWSLRCPNASSFFYTFSLLANDLIDLIAFLEIDFEQHVLNTNSWIIFYFMGNDSWN